MGDRFYLTLNCAYCGLTSRVYYAPTCGLYDFRCMTNDESVADLENGCGKLNFITSDFCVKKIEDVVEEDVVAAFEMATSANHSMDAIKREAKGYLKRIKKENDRQSSSDTSADPDTKA